MERDHARQVTPVEQFDAIELLTRNSDARERFLAQLGEGPDIDAQLVADVLRVGGRVGATLQTRRALVELCALVRAIDAAVNRRIDLFELRAGLSIHAARTDDFESFHETRVLLRTLAELLADERRFADGADGPLRSQIAYLDGELRSWLVEQLTGSADETAPAADPAPPPAADPREPFRAQGEERRAADALVTELLEGARHHPVTGLLGAAWVRAWSAVPISGDRLGDDPGELKRLLDALPSLDPSPTSLVQINRMRSARWTLDGRTLTLGDQLRDGWVLPASMDGLQLAAAERLGPTTITTFDLAFAYVEADGYHALLGPRSFVEEVCG
ncbi:MAG: hypothetical protein ABI200_06670, partial [Gaiellales bacterium]